MGTFPLKSGTRHGYCTHSTLSWGSNQGSKTRKKIGIGKETK